MIKTFQHHLSGSKFMLVDVEKEGSAAVFDFIKDHVRQQVWLKPNEETISRYILQANTISIIIRQLTTEAPLQFIQSVPTVTIEKMLVDLYGDDEFNYMDNNEKAGIFRNAYERFTINQNKLLRYAARKSKRKKIATFLAENNLIKKTFGNHDFQGNA